MWEIPPRVVLMFKSLLCSPRPTSLPPSWLNQFTGRTTFQLFHLHRDEEDGEDFFLFGNLEGSPPYLEILHGIPPYGPATLLTAPPWPILTDFPQICSDNLSSSSSSLQNSSSFYHHNPCWSISPDFRQPFRNFEDLITVCLFRKTHIQPRESF